jgi:hypothetical protein
MIIKRPGEAEDQVSSLALENVLRARFSTSKNVASLPPNAVTGTADQV